MTDVHQKMSEYLQLRALGERSVRQYLLCASVFMRQQDTPPDQWSTDDVRRFLLQLAEMKRSSATRAVYHSSLKYLFTSMGRPEVMQDVPRPRVRVQRPGRALTRAEVVRLLALLEPHPFDYAFFSLMLATGLRIAETAALQVHDLDRRAGLLHVRRGKGFKPRSVMLSVPTLEMLETYWRATRPRAPFLFPARTSGWERGTNRPWAMRSISPNTMSKRPGGEGPTQVMRADGVRHVPLGDLELVEDGYDLRHVQVLLGHASPETTARYVRVHADVIARTRSPFDRL